MHRRSSAGGILSTGLSREAQQFHRNHRSTMELSAFHIPSPTVADIMNQRRSTPRTVMGRLKVGWPCQTLEPVIGLLEEPAHEARGPHGHSESEDDPRKGAFRSTLSEGEHQASVDDCHE